MITFILGASLFVPTLIKQEPIFINVKEKRNTMVYSENKQMFTDIGLINHVSLSTCDTLFDGVQ